jgi:carbamoyl-phosphate synthase large subunit
MEMFMKEYNILILSAGRRVELVNRFKSAIENLELKGKIIAGDCSDLAPALYFADEKIILPRVDSGKYINAIIDVCKEFSVDLVVPTIDTELLLLSEYKKEIELKGKCKLLISSNKVIEICRDKILTQKYLEDKGFGIPKMFSYEDIVDEDFPLFIKPKSGSSSIDAYKLESMSDLNNYIKMVNDPIIQEFAEGEEYTVDVFVDFDGNIITIVPRLRIATRSGEIAKGRIVKDPLIINDVKILINELKPIGHITVQLMKTSDGIKYIEINPRFGGGAPMSIDSGANSCENLLKLMCGKRLSYNENYRDNVTFLRFDSSICIDDNLEIIK